MVLCVFQTSVAGRRQNAKAGTQRKTNTGTHTTVGVQTYPPMPPLRGLHTHTEREREVEMMVNMVSV